MKVMSAMLSVLLILGGCTSMQPAKVHPDVLEQQLRAGRLVAVGDDVEIVTHDDQRHRFRVTGIDNNTIEGKAIAIPIDSIKGLKTREFSAEKTALLAGSVFALFMLGLSQLTWPTPG